MVLDYAFTGDSVSEIPTWDFDDGTEPVQAWSGSHKYEETGTYYVKQTAKNNVGTVETYYKVQIMGYPYIEFVANEGSETETIQLTRFGEPVPEELIPEDPVRDGYDFTGWYRDSKCEVPFDWGTDIEEAITLYAGWELSEVEYTISFDVDGGSVPMEDQKVSNGDLFTVPVYEGVKAGATFGGWSWNGQTYQNPQTITVTQDIELKAVWNVDSFTVTFETDGGSEVKGQTVAYNGTVEVPDTPTKAGHDFAGWFTADGEEYDFETPVTSNLVLTAHWTPRTYTVSFDTGEGSDVQSQQVQYGQKAQRPEDPTRSGYDFDGWYLGGSLYDFDTPVTGDIELTAAWEKVSQPSKNWTVTYVYNNGEDNDVYRLSEGSRLNEPKEPVWEGHTFVGWFVDGVEFEFPWTVSKDITIEARWTVNEYTVSFVTSHGTAPADQTVAYGDLAKQPSAPAWDGGRFLGWYVGDVQFDFGIPIQGDIELTAKWAPYVAKISIDSDGDGKADRIIGLIEGESYQLPTPNRPGYSFQGWDTDGDGKADMQAGQSFAPTKDVTITALWKDESKLTVTFDIDGKLTERTVSYGSRVAQPADPSKDGYTFDGWFVNGEEYDFSSRVTSDITITAKWTKVHTVTVVPDDGYVTPIDPVVPDGGEIVLPDATKPGSVLEGWDTDGDGEADASAGDVVHVEDDMTLEPVWEDVPEGTVQYTIAIEGADIGIAGWVLAEGESIELPPAEREGYAFQGWLIDGTLYEAWEEFSPTKDVTAVAQWSELPKHDVEVSVDEDASVSSEVPSEVPEGSTVTLPDATKPGSVLEGWDTDGDGVADARPGDDITVDDDTVVKPVWRPVGDDEDQYEIGFDGSASIDTWYPVDGGSVVLPEPEDSEGFEGWYDGDEYIGMPGDTWYPSADATLTAKHSSADGDDHGALAYVWIVCLVLCVGFVLFLAWDKTVWLAIPAVVLAALAVITFYLWGGFL